MDQALLEDRPGGRVEAFIQARFDTDGDDVKVVDNVQPGSIFLNEEELAANGFTDADVARAVQTMTQTDAQGNGVTPQPGEENDPVFQAVFPSAMMQDLSCLPEAQKTTDII